MASEYTDEAIVMALLSGNSGKVEAVIDLTKSILAETGVTTAFLESPGVDGAFCSSARGMS